jgi:hypothetical protein
MAKDEKNTAAGAMGPLAQKPPHSEQYIQLIYQISQNS